MKILLISDNKIHGIGGGSLEEKKYYDGIKEYCKSKCAEFSVISPDEVLENAFPITVKKNRLMDVAARLIGHSTYYYIVWSRWRKKVLMYQPDLIFIGRSRMGFIAHDVKKKLPSCRIILNMENVEFDYVESYFSGKGKTMNKLYALLEKICVKRDEKAAISHADALNFLTIRDKKRTHKLYAPVEKREAIIPICIERQTMLTKVANTKNVIFVGSLGYRSNAEAIAIFIQELWQPYYAYRDDIKLIVGGNSPTESLVEQVNAIGNCELHSNFESLESIIPIGSMVIAPIKHGAGMKVKVAQTLSMGLMIAASDEALIGYEEAIKEEHDGGIIRANTVEDYCQAIESYLRKTKSELEIIGNQNKALYQRYYSYDRSRKAIAELIDSGE